MSVRNSPEPLLLHPARPYDAHSAAWSDLRPPDAPAVVAAVLSGNEARQLSAAVSRQVAPALQQTRPLDHVVVVGDSRDSHVKAAVALNEVLRAVLPALRPDDAVLVTDDDCALDPCFVARTLVELEYDETLAGACSHFSPALSARSTSPSLGVALWRVAALRSVVTARAAGQLAGPLEVLDPAVRLPSFELVLALEHLGWRVDALDDAPTGPARHSRGQRREQRAAQRAVLRRYGLTRHSWRHWLRLARL